VRFVLCACFNSHFFLLRVEELSTIHLPISFPITKSITGIASTPSGAIIALVHKELYAVNPNSGGCKLLSSSIPGDYRGCPCGMVVVDSERAMYVCDSGRHVILRIGLEDKYFDPPISGILTSLHLFCFVFFSF
jgi:hypothetical protein